MSTTSLISPLMKSLAAKTKKTKTGYASTVHMNEMEWYAKEQGLHRLGSGAYSVVFTHETDPKKVVKISLSAADGYHKFVQWVLANKPLLKPHQRRHLPRIYETITYKGARITVLEKLNKASERDVELDEDVERIVKDTANLLGFRDDSGGRNLMARGNIGVITDPWAHRDNQRW